MAIINITDEAAKRMKALIEKRETPPLGLRFGTEEKGCSGLSYKVDYVDRPDPGDEMIEHEGIKVFIERASLMHLIGSTIDFEENSFSSGFVFVNPNEKSRCGCGESFNV